MIFRINMNGTYGANIVAILFVYVCVERTVTFSRTRPHDITEKTNRQTMHIAYILIKTYIKIMNL